MDQQDPHPVNSRRWWDDYFQGKWDDYGGSEQTRYFMETLLSHLPEQERAYFKRGAPDDSGLGVRLWGGCGDIGAILPAEPGHGPRFFANGDRSGAYSQCGS